MKPSPRCPAWVGKEVKMKKLAPGDIVRRVSGWSPMVVVQISPGGNHAEVAYCGASHDYADIAAVSRIVLVTNPEKEFALCSNWRHRLDAKQTERLLSQTLNNHISKEADMPKLYQTKEETPRFGTHLAVNSAGKIVLEMKGSGEVLAFDKKAVEEVRPYTVDVKFNNSGTTYSYFAVKGCVSVGDILLIDGGTDYARVMKVDSKSDKATKHLKGRRLMTEEIAGSDEISVVSDEGDDLLFP
jgi:hypothetical protein